MKKLLTLCIPIKDRRVLLGLKKRGFGVGRWNGFGGKVEEGETIMEAAFRELQEEVGITTGTLKEAGVLEFSFQNDDKLLEVHIFTVVDFLDEPVETEEMKPQWFAFDQIPFAHMWSDDEYWFPLLLSGTPFEGAFLFDRPSDAEYSAKILSQRLTVKSPPPPLKDGDHCTVIAGTHNGKSGQVADVNTSKTGAVTITVIQTSGERFKTLAKNVVRK